MNHYIECLDLIKKSPPSIKIELIHDLDHPESNIPQIASLETSREIKATYFIRLHAKNYNALSLSNIQAYRNLSDQGHRLGLHFEPSFYEKNEVIEAISKESQLLEFTIGRPIKSVSIHEPARFGSIDQYSIPSNLKYYCYDSKYYQNKKYISDSGGRWREGCMCQHIGKHSEMIILTHPIWWYEKTSAENY